VIDDLHWADLSSLPMIELLVRTAPTIPFILLFGSRTGPLPDWLESNEVERDVLGGLDRDEVAALAGSVAGATVTDEDAGLVHERTAGNPLFVGETVRAMLEDGRLEIHDGRVRVIGDIGGGPLPVTLRALLGARIDALPESAREIMGVASVIGVAFKRQLLEDLIGRRIRGPILARLLDSALIYQSDDGASWRFAHDLIRDVAYAGLLTASRRVLHSRLADLYEREPRAGIGRAAVHRAAAGEAELALPMLEESAQRALAVGANAEAAGFWRMAAELVGDVDPRRDAYIASAQAAIPPEVASGSAGDSVASA
jgi:predicted ATPase